jgi:hypothetical protein
MAVATSFTATRIQELLAGWEHIGLSQDEINALVLQLKTGVDAMDSSLSNFNENIRPIMEMELAANSAAVSDLNDNVLPNLQQDLTAASETIDDLVSVVVPSLQESVANSTLNINERPYVYVQDEAPENPDENDRELVVGDSWFDSNDNNRQRIWNGVEWSTFNVDVADFSLTVKSFLSGKHQIY